MKQVSTELVYPGTTVEAVASLLADPAFREAVLDGQGVQRREVSVTRAGDGHTVVLDYAHGNDRLPSFARKFVGEEISIRQEEVWQGESARVTVTIPGKPGDMTGTATLAQRGADVVERVDMAVKVGIPLVGGKIEDLIGSLLLKAVRAENRLGVEWLAR